MRLSMSALSVGVVIVNLAFPLFIFPSIATAQETNQITRADDIISVGNLQNVQKLTGFLNSQNPTDIYQFTLNSSSGFELRLDGLTADADVELYQDKNKNGVPGDDESINTAKNSGSIAEFISQFLEPGTYFIKVYQTLGDTPYTLNLSTTLDAGNELAKALNLGNLSSPITLQESVGQDDTDDFYHFSLSALSNMTLKLEQLTGDVDVELIWDGNEDQKEDFYPDVLAFSNNHEQLEEEIKENLPEGNYYIRVYQYSGDSQYTLNLTATPGDKPIESEFSIGVLTGTYNHREFVGNEDQKDIYNFTLNTPSHLLLSLNGLNEDADVFLFQDQNKDGGINEENEAIYISGKNGVHSEIINRSVLDVGNYYVVVKRYADNNTNYNLTLSATPLGQISSATITNPNFDPNFGFGLVDAAAAVARAMGVPKAFTLVPNPIENSYGVNLINAPAVWNQGITGKGVIVAVLDTGVDLKHPDLQENLWVNSDEIADDGIDNDNNGLIDDTHGFDFADHDSDPSPNLQDARYSCNPGHGTHVSGIIAGIRNGINGKIDDDHSFDVTGVAYNATIMPIRVLFLRDYKTNEEGADDFSDRTIASGIYYAVNNGARVVNMSLSGYGGLPGSLMKAALSLARERGVIVVISSGNEHRNYNAIVPGEPAFWATENLAIAVGSVDHTRHLVSYSNPAGTLFTPYPFVVAPGVDIRSAVPNNRYEAWGGTSMAAPHVAGVVALMLEANPNLTPDEIYQILMETANPTGITIPNLSQE